MPRIERDPSEPTFLLLQLVLLAGRPVPAAQAPRGPAPRSLRPTPAATPAPPATVRSPTDLAHTPHGKSGFAALSAHGCETCHGPGSAHAEDPDNPALLPRVDKLRPAQQSAVCPSCHDTGKQQFFWHGSAHAGARPLLHELPQRPLLQVGDRAAQERERDGAVLHLPQGRARRDLEDLAPPAPRGQDRLRRLPQPARHRRPPRLITAASVNDQCYTCHAEKRGPFLWEHPPVRESCMNCHTPHGSNHLKLQQTSVPYLCQQCHANTRHPGTLYDGLRAAHARERAADPASNRLFNRACLDCHAAIHGSNHPSSPYLAH